MFDSIAKNISLVHVPRKAVRLSKVVSDESHDGLKEKSWAFSD